MNYQESFRKNESSFYFRIVHEEIGIKLTRGESTTLIAIIHSFEEAKKRGRKYLLPKVEGAFKFYLEQFGFNLHELCKFSRVLLGDKEFPIFYGMGLLENEDFKEYYKRNVHKWREENTFECGYRVSDALDDRWFEARKSYIRESEKLIAEEIKIRGKFDRELIEGEIRKSRK